MAVYNDRPVSLPVTVTLALVIALVALVLIMTGLWQQQKRTGNAGVVDVAWSFATGIAGVWLALVPIAGAASHAPRQWLVAAMAALWSARLGYYILARSRGRGEDPRYRAYREQHGARADVKLFSVFQFNAVFALIFGALMMIAARNPTPALTWLDGLGAIVWLIAVGGEAASDRTLDRFKADPANRGQVCDRGLWRYTRHPNYFFEWLHWFAYVALAVPVGASYPWMWLTLLGPLAMYVIVNRMTGIPPTERHLLASRGDAYRAYQARTNAFFPGPVRRR
jgi:steroid 5-alpha reductase family enzyme